MEDGSSTHDLKEDEIDVKKEDGTGAISSPGIKDDAVSVKKEENGAVSPSGTKKDETDVVKKDENGETSPSVKEDVMEVGNKEKDDAQESTADVTQNTKSPIKEEPEVKPFVSKELDIGISEYLGDHSGFFGILKQRYSDFVVNEVTNAGDVVHLTDLSAKPVPEIQIEMPAELPPQLTPEVIQQIEDLVGVPRPARIPLTSQEAEEVLIDVEGVSKEGRGNIHMAVKAKYRSVISCYREEPDGRKLIVIQKKKAKGKNVIPKRNEWPRAFLYTTFVLYKENIDTIDAINHIARRLGVKANMFAYAGTKDRRGKTSQLVSVPRVAPEKLCKAASQRRTQVGDFKFLPTPQKLGQLKGNRFHIVLREVKEQDELIMSSIKSLKTNGFINYFGSQRFGTTAISTHLIGRELLKSNWLKAVNLILAPRENDNFMLNKCRLVWKDTCNAEEALRMLKGEKESSIEGKLLMGLKDKTKNDIVGALGSIPRNVRVLYLHAYQSYIWNKVVSRRIKKYGLATLPGDIIRRKDSANTTDEDCLEEEDGSDQNIVNDSENNAEKKSATDVSNFHFLSEEEAKTVPIKDVLLPLPGHRIEYPKNEIKDWYVEFLEADGLNIEALNHRVKCYSVMGSYRRLIVQPSDIEASIAYYDDPTKPLIQSDMDRLLSESIDGNLLKEGQNKGVIIEMTLPASAYATMALRELLKMDTSSAFQATLNTTCPSSNSTPNSGKGCEGSGYDRQDGGRNDRHREGRGAWRGRGGFHRGFHGGRNLGFRGNHHRGRGEKRHWRGSHGGRGGKRSKFSHKDY